MNYTNITIDTVDFTHVCELNQAQMLESTAKIPATGYYILLFGLACLLFYFFVQPRLSKNVGEALLHYPGILGTCLIFLSAWVLFLGVFQLGEEELTTLSRVASWMILPLLVLAVWAGYKWWRRKK